MSRAIEFVATDPEPSFKYTPAYREFFARLRRARIAKGLSLLEVAELVGLDLCLAYEFENLIAPLPFEWLEVWCNVVGVPFNDYLAVYWASEEAYATAKEREAQEREAQERGAIGINSTDTPTFALSLSPPRTASANIVARTARFFRLLFSAP